MKKKILFLLVMIIANVTNIYSQQSIGHWVLVDEATITPLFNQNVKNYTFYHGNIDNNNIDVTDIEYNTLNLFQNDEIRISDGVYDKNDNLIFYLINNKVFDVSNNEVGQLSYGGSNANTMGPELRIMQKPGTTNVYQVYYTYYVDNGQQEVDKGSFAYVDITNNNETITIGNSEVITSSPDWNVGFALDFTVIDDWYVYYTTSSNGVYRQSILPDGTVDPNSVQEIINEDEPIIGNYHKFAAYNFELKRDEDENVVFAWVTNKDIGKGELYICKLQGSDITNKQIVKHQVSTNRINGIEFSTIEDEENVIYLSIENEGLKKLADYMSQNPTITTVSNGTSFANTYVQEGPDKSIYAVKDDGSKLGRIEYPSGVFDNSTEDMNYTTYLPGENDIKRFFLPERTGVFNMIDFTVETGYIDCECPSGEITWAQVQNLEGGESPYYFTWYNGSGTVLLEGWGEDGIENLTEGDYTVCIHDSNNPPLEECYDFSIELDPDLYTDWNMIDIYSGTANWSNESKRLKQGIYVHDGADFTIEGSNLQFGPEAKIIVDRGATLTLDNTTLTYLNQCKCLWKGIEVWGNSQLEQLEQYQGKLIIKNNSMIEGAELAINLQKSGDISKTGGIVIAENSQFSNNAKSLYAADYEYFYEDQVTGKKYYKNNRSFFKNCSFDINSNYLYENINSIKFLRHIELKKVRGVRFYACDFSVQDGVTGVYPTKHAIAAYDAGFSVKGYCLSPSVPCSNFKVSTLTGFYMGIYAVNGGSVHTYVVDSVHFINNTYGIYTSNEQFETVIRSLFQIGINNTDKESCEEQGSSSSAYGIYLDNSSGFAIEENNFYKYSGAPEGIYTGIKVKDCPSASDNIYRNEFLGLSYGNLAEGKNRSDLDDDGTGVAYTCNNNSNNNYDFFVAKKTWIRGNMGDPTNPSGNILTNPEVSQVQFQNNYTQDIRYYYNANEPDEKLVKYSDYVFPYAINYENTCPSHYGGGSGGGTGKGVILTPEQKMQAEQDFSNNLSDYNNVKALYENLKDGGNTELTKSEIELSWPDDMWELRSDLLGKSPHLSKEVLMIAADKTDVLPESVLFEILSANPDELRKEDLINYLENKEQPLPEYMISILKQLAGGVTYKTILLGQMSEYYHKKVSAAQDIIRSISNDSIFDTEELRNWLDNLGGLNQDKQIISTYIREKDYSSAQNLLDMIPSLYNLGGDDLLDFNNYKTFTQWQINLEQQGKTIFELDSTDLNYLNDIAENGFGSTQSAARSILEYAYVHHYCNCISLPDSIGLKSSSIIFDDKLNNPAIEINAVPNPASVYVSFNYKLPVNSSATILISDINGKEIDRIKITSDKGQKVWDTRNIKPGVYIYQIESQSMQKKGKLIIK